MKRHSVSLTESQMDDIAIALSAKKEEMLRLKAKYPNETEFYDRRISSYESCLTEINEAFTCTLVE